MAAPSTPCQEDRLLAVYDCSFRGTAKDSQPRQRGSQSSHLLPLSSRNKRQIEHCRPRCPGRGDAPGAATGPPSSKNVRPVQASMNGCAWLKGGMPHPTHTEVYWAVRGSSNPFQRLPDPAVLDVLHVPVGAAVEAAYEQQRRSTRHPSHHMYASYTRSEYRGPLTMPGASSHWPRHCNKGVCTLTMGKLNCRRVPVSSTVRGAISRCPDRHGTERRSPLLTPIP